MPPAAMEPSLVQVLGPYVAGVLTLAGVALTLSITGRREKVRNAAARYDQFLREQRDLCSETLGAAHRFNVAAVSFSYIEYWTREGEERAKSMLDDVNSTGEVLHTLLLRFRLVVQDDSLADACDQLFHAYSSCFEQVGRVMDEFWAFGAVADKRLHPFRHSKERDLQVDVFRKAEKKLRRKLAKMQEEAAAFHDAARLVLVPDLKTEVK